MFDLNPTLAADTLDVGALPLCQCLLMNDSRYPWLILVPRVADITELLQLNQAQIVRLWPEIRWASELLQAQARITKLNVAALGNMVPQLHIHVIGRHSQDAAWPGPVWGVGPAIPYAAPEAAQQLARYQRALAQY